MYIYSWDVCNIDESYEKQSMSVSCDKQCRYVVVLQCWMWDVCSCYESSMFYYTAQFIVQIISVFIVINNT